MAIAEKNLAFPSGPKGQYKGISPNVPKTGWENKPLIWTGVVFFV
jgi:hypothetical protein